MARAVTRTSGKFPSAPHSPCSRTNGGFYPEQTIAAYQNTYVNKLRFYSKQPINKKD